MFYCETLIFLCVLDSEVAALYSEKLRIAIELPLCRSDSASFVACVI